MALAALVAAPGGASHLDGHLGEVRDGGSLPVPGEPRPAESGESSAPPAKDGERAAGAPQPDEVAPAPLREREPPVPAQVLQGGGEETGRDDDPKEASGR